MKFTVKTEGETTLVLLDGRLDLATGGNLKEEVKKICEKGNTKVHLNLQNVDFINSSGLGALVFAMKQVRLKKGRLTLSNLTPYVREIFEITQLVNVFDIYETQQEALAPTQKVML